MIALRDRTIASDSECSGLSTIQAHFLNDFVLAEAMPYKYRLLPLTVSYFTETRVVLYSVRELAENLRIERTEAVGGRGSRGSVHGHREKQRANQLYMLVKPV